ncbi:hypothetical protein GCM10025868_41520 [Angustibacter aerolatus]|uniref:ATPase F1/V1/A1 complex alpha/beta subunit N-terminal domain-containing protein n=1 Tax=Angustibacter aerolatus TaxID=1162965 RepID=A0ABQ6JKV8_9ACTN|nr:hypothetical protein GCM10025868_41520 [Angustibacter aerolatus]
MARPQRTGRISAVVGLLVEVVGVDAAVGDLLLLGSTTGLDGVPAEVVGADRTAVKCMPLGLVQGLRVGDPVAGSGDGLRIRVGADLLGRVVDGLGRPSDGEPAARRASSASTTRRRTPCCDNGSTHPSRSASGRSTRSCPPAAASASASSPAPASASRACCR